MSTEVKDKLSLPKIKARKSARFVFSDDAVDFFETFKGGYLEEAAEDMLATMDRLAGDFIEDTRKFIQNAYDAMWDNSAFYTGNFRGAIKMVGNFATDPLNCGIDFDESWFMTPKMLPSLKERTVHREWKSKKHGARAKGYTYPAGKMVKITGEDYRPRVPSPSPYVMEYLEELEDAEFKKAGL